MLPPAPRQEPVVQQLLGSLEMVLSFTMVDQVGIASSDGGMASAVSTWMVADP